jgi:hypothetical protein
MRKLLLSLLVLLCGHVAAQDSDPNGMAPKHELKLNATNLIVAAYLDGAYEYLINEESSVGVGLLVGLGEDDILDGYRSFSLTPYFRQFFSKGYAKGFFVEGFGMLNTGTTEDYIYNQITFDHTYTENSYTAMAFGISIGGKFVTKRGFVAELYAGVGRNLIGTDWPDFVGRGGVSLGYRF